MEPEINPELCAALIKARADIKNPLREASAQRHKYAKLETICEQINPVLAANDLTFFQRIYNDGQCVTAETILVHASGSTLSSTGPAVPARDLDAHGVGAACTYAKRYSLTSFFGIEATADDDAKETMKQGGGTVKKLPDQPAPRDAPGVDESGLDEMAIKATYANQINALNAAAKAKNAEEFAKQHCRIPKQDLVAVYGAVLSYARTFSKSDGMASLIAEYEQTMNEPAEGLL